MIAGLLLAAGRSSRFGSDKLCATIEGAAVVTWSVRVLESLDEVVVVTPDDDAVSKALAGVRVRIVRNPERDNGLASSLRTGLLALPAQTEAVVVALGDQPFASSRVTERLVAAWREGVDIVVPLYSDGRGHPVLFAARCFAALQRLQGDAGARDLIASGEFRVATVIVEGPMPIDVDTPEALALAARRATDDASIHPPSV